MPPVGVVAADVTEFRVAGLVAGVECEVPEVLDLEGCEETVGGRVVPAAAPASHTVDQADGHQRLTVVAAVVPAVAGRAVEEASRWSRYTDGFSSHASEEYRCLG